MGVLAKFGVCLLDQEGPRAKPLQLKHLAISNPNPGAPNSPKQVIFVYFRAQSRYYVYTWSPREKEECSSRLKAGIRKEKEALTYGII